MNHWNIKYIFNISSELYKIKVKVPRSFLFAKLASLYVWCFPIPTNTLIFTTCLSQIQKATLSPKLRLQPWQNHVPQVNVYNSRHWWFSQNMLFRVNPVGWLVLFSIFERCLEIKSHDSTVDSIKWQHFLTGQTLFATPYKIFSAHRNSKGFPKRSLIWKIGIIWWYWKLDEIGSKVGIAKPTKS